MMYSTIDQGRLFSSMACDHQLLLEALTKYISPQQIQEILQQTGCQSLRRRKIPAAATVWLVLCMGLRADLDMGALWRQLYGVMASLWQAAEGIKPPCKSALCQARQRLGARPMRQLFLQTGRSATTGKTRNATYKGMPLRIMDGDDYNTPDTPANDRAFGRPGTKRHGKKLPAGYPQLHLNRLIEADTHLCLEAIINPCGTSDHVAAPKLLAAAAAGDLVLIDCGFYSFNLLQQAQQQNKFFLCRTPKHVKLPVLERLPDGSYLSEIYPSHTHRHAKRAGITVRVLEYTIDDPARPGHSQRQRLVTNLLDWQKYPVKELIVLYHQRWEIELDNDEITTHQLNRAVELRSRTPAGVVQELYGLLIGHNVVRSLMHEAALSVDIDPRRLSFMHAVRVLRDVMPVMRSAPTIQLPYIYKTLIALISQGKLPPRDGRINPRVVKVACPSKFPVKKPHHYQTPQPKTPFAASIVLLN